MVAYEKELQERISALETEKSQMETNLFNLKEDLSLKEQEIVQIKKTNEEEICTLKQDLELKIRHEREKENSHKEFQKQSIEYEKKLQDQIEEKNQILDKIKNELETQRKAIGTQKEFYVKEIKSLENKLDQMNA